MFAKNDNGNLLTAVSAVKSADYSLEAEKHEEYTYPVDGWYWFDTETAAREFFDLPENDFQVPQEVQPSFLADN